MERHAVVAAFIFAFLILAVEGSLLANPASANFGPITIPKVQVTVSSPKNDTVYYTSNVDLKFSVTIQDGSYQHVNYYLDGKLLETFIYAPSSFSVTLPELSNGQHSVEVTAQAEYVMGLKVIYSCKIFFTINTPIVPPQVIIVSMQNQTFQTANAAFNFTVNKPATWLAYSLDQNDNVTITQTAALTRPYGVDNYYQALTAQTDGTHTLTFYAKDTLGNIGKSDTISFTTNTQPETSPSQTPPNIESPSPTSSNYQTPQQTITPTNTLNPSFSLQPSTTEQPKVTPSQQLTPLASTNETETLLLQNQLLFAAVVAVVVLVIVAVALVFWKKSYYKR